MSVKQQKRIRRHKKIRMRLHGTKDRPRLFVFRSNQHIYAQLINDDNNKIIASASAGQGCDEAKKAGKLIAKQAIGNKIDKVVFDRGGVVFHGRVKALADGAREAGLKF